MKKITLPKRYANYNPALERAYIWNEVFNAASFTGRKHINDPVKYRLCANLMAFAFCMKWSHMNQFNGEVTA